MHVTVRCITSTYYIVCLYVGGVWHFHGYVFVYAKHMLVTLMLLSY